MAASREELSEMAESVADTITKEQWVLLDDDQQLDLLELTSPMLLSRGLLPEHLTDYFEHGKHVSLLDEVMGESEEAIADLTKRVMDMIVSGPTIEFTKHGQAYIAVRS